MPKGYVRGAGAHKRTSLAETRTYLAAERVFASWLRLALAGIGGALAAIAFLAEATLTRIAATFLLMTAAAIFISAYVYVRPSRAGALNEPEETGMNLDHVALALAFASLALIPVIWLARY